MYEIKRNQNKNINDETCVEYSMYVPIENVNIIQDEYGDKPSEEDYEKYIDFIKNQIDFTKENYYGSFANVVDKTVKFRVWTKDEELLKKESYLREELDLEEWSRLVFNDNGWVEIGGYPISKESIEYLNEKFPIEDWKVCHNWHMEYVYLAVKFL